MVLGAMGNPNGLRLWKPGRENLLGRVMVLRGKASPQTPNGRYESSYPYD
jgi:hypothetical protein